MYYSQCKEDSILNKCVFKNKKNGVYIELGALDGVLYSNTKFFEDSLNWTGILIEPHPDKFKFLQKNRPNNFLSNDLVSCHTEPLDFRYFVNHHAAVSGIATTLPQKHIDNYFENKENEIINSLPQNMISIKPRTLTEIVKESKFTHIDLLSLDVEGHEYEVLQSWDFSTPIDVILLETLEDHPDKNKMCEELLLNNNYKFISDYKHNKIYTHKTFLTNYNN
jgi:FkbM family methyltransferase